MAAQTPHPQMQGHWLFQQSKVPSPLQIKKHKRFRPMCWTQLDHGRHLGRVFNHTCGSHRVKGTEKPEAAVRCVGDLGKLGNKALNNTATPGSWLFCHQVTKRHDLARQQCHQREKGAVFTADCGCVSKKTAGMMIRTHCLCRRISVGGGHRAN